MLHLHLHQQTQIWNGTNWTEQADLILVDMITEVELEQQLLLSFWWKPKVLEVLQAATEEWTGAGAAVGAWSTGGSLNTAREQNTGFQGTYTAALAIWWRQSNTRWYC
jgi:hypothetical protein